MRNYVSAELDVIKLSVEDVITTSPTIEDEKPGEWHPDIEIAGNW